MAREELEKQIRKALAVEARPIVTGGQERIISITEGFRDLSLLLAAGLCPEGRELALALTKMEEACFWATKAVLVEDPA